MFHDIRLKSAQNPPEVRARPPEQHHQPCVGRPDHQEDGITIVKIRQPQPPDSLDCDEMNILLKITL